MRDRLGVRRFDCPDCDYETTDPEKYQDHRWNHHQAKREADIDSPVRADRSSTLATRG